MTELAHYRVATDLALNLEVPFDALVMAALLRSVPGVERDRLTVAFPSLAAEVAARRVTPTGVLPHEVDLNRFTPSPVPRALDDATVVAAAERYGAEIDPGPVPDEQILAWPYADTRSETVS